MPMIYRNLIGKNHCSSGLIGMSDAGSGKQVKESKSSERKNTQMSLIFHLIFLCSVLLFYSCNNHEKYDFESSDEALNEYDNLYKTVRSQETCNAEQLAHLSICGMNAQTQSTNLFRKTLRLRLMPV